jgi:hypothetical protein
MSFLMVLSEFRNIVFAVFFCCLEGSRLSLIRSKQSFFPIAILTNWFIFSMYRIRIIVNCSARKASAVDWMCDWLAPLLLQLIFEKPSNKFFSTSEVVLNVAIFNVNHPLTLLTWRPCTDNLYSKSFPTFCLSWLFLQVLVIYFKVNVTLKNKLV